MTTTDTDTQSISRATLRYALDTPAELLGIGAGILFLSGYPPARFLSGEIVLAQRIHADDQDIVAALFAAGELPAQGVYNLRLRQADGRIRCLRASDLKHREGSRTLLDLDLQDAKSLPRTLSDAAATANFRAMMENTNDFIYFKDRNHVFTGASRTLVSLCSPAEHWTDLLGQTDYDVFPEELADTYYRLEKDIFSGMPVAQEIQRILGKDGRPGWVDNRKYPIHNEQGEIVGLFGIARDITAALQTAEELRLSEQRFRTLFENTPSIAVQGYDTARRVIFWNRASEILYGYSRQEALGQLLEDLIIPAAMRQATIEAITAWAAGGPAIPAAELVLRNKDGAPVPVFSSHVMQSGQDGPEMYCLDISMSEQRQAEANLRQSEEHLRLALSAARQSWFDANVQTGEIQIGAEYPLLLGYAPDAFHSNVQNWLEHIHPDDLTAVREAFQSCILSGGPATLEYRRLTATGEWKWMLSTGEIVEWDAAGRALRMAGIHQDITARKLIEAELEQHRRHLEEMVMARTVELLEAKIAAETANRTKSAFLANMSHELRTPMNGIMGMLALARRRMTDPTGIDQLNKAKSAAEHLLRVLNDILDLSKIEAERMVLETLPLQLGDILANLTGLIGHKAADKGLQFAVDLPEPLALMPLQGDPLRLGQILLNLAGNAIKFTDRGRIEIRIRQVSESPHGVQVRFDIVDSGIGIDPAAQSRLFTAFEQADNSMTRKYGGTGLGLAICKRLVELMGGEIGVDSTPGAGSTFWFAVPLARRASGAVAPAPTSAADDAETRLRCAHAGRRVLLAEDEPVNREVALCHLEDAGLATDLAEDGQQAVALARKNDYSLILMDMQMPRMNGIEATRAIRADSLNRATPIVAMTANAFDDDRQSCLAAGMNDHLAKPVKPEVLFETLLKWLSRPPD